jgi:hypothetical protein
MNSIVPLPGAHIKLNAAEMLQRPAITTVNFVLPLPGAPIRKAAIERWLLAPSQFSFETPKPECRTPL